MQPTTYPDTGSPEAKQARVHPALQRRSALVSRRPRAVRRHTKRVATRFVVLLSGDIAALVGMRLLVDFVGVASVLPAALLSSTLLTDGPKRFTLLLFSFGFSLFITGSHSRHRALNESVRLLVAVALAPLPFIARTIIEHGPGAVAQGYVVTVLLAWCAIAAVRKLTELILRHLWPGQRGAASAVLVCGREGAATWVERAIAGPGGDYRVVGHVSVDRAGPESLGRVQDLPTIVEQHDVEAVVVCDELRPEQMNRLLSDCLMAGCQMLYPARAVRVEGVRPSLVWHYDQPFFELGSPVLKAKALISKRILDLVASAILLVLTAPLLLVIALAIRLDSPGPALFFQERAGLGGRRLRMLKFRTMRVGADSEKAQLAHLNGTGDKRLFKIRSDPRVTRLGRLLRRWSLDELPQLWNVLVGDMSLVGPRPFFESDFDAYEEHHFRRLDAKPGITGLWQVSGRSAVLNFEDVIYLDRQYIEQWSFWLDISILFRTIPAVLRRTGAY